MKMAAFGSVETTSIPQVTRLYSKEDLVRASSRHSGCAVAALYHSSLLWEHFAAHTPTCTLSLQRRLCVSNAVSYECVENLFISQRGAPGLDTLIAWIGINHPERLGVTIQHKVLPGDTSLHSLLLSARCTMHFDCGGGRCRKLFPERLIWQKATTARLGWPVDTIIKSSS
jgi:hypothetical protein